jgi:hypothetical protein
MTTVVNICTFSIYLFTNHPIILRNIFQILIASYIKLHKGSNHHWLYSPVWTLASFRSFLQLPAGCCFFRFRVKCFSLDGGCEPQRPIPSNPGGPMSSVRFTSLSRFLPIFVLSGTRFSPLHDSAVKCLPRSHDVDEQASDFLGINGLTGYLIEHTHQQDVYPRGHILLL